MFLTTQLPFLHISLRWQQVTQPRKMNRNTIHTNVNQALLQHISVPSMLRAMHCKCSATHWTVKLLGKQILKFCLWNICTDKFNLLCLSGNKKCTLVLKQWQVQRKWQNQQNNSYWQFPTCPNFLLIFGWFFHFVEIDI